MGGGTPALSRRFSQALTVSQISKDRFSCRPDCVESKYLIPETSRGGSLGNLNPPNTLDAEKSASSHSNRANMVKSMASLDAVPSLSSDAASASASSSSVSLDTELASELAHHEILQDDGNGALVVPLRSPHRRQHIYICLFHVLDCRETFDDADLWRTHVLSHFRTHEPPTTARCPLCPGERFNDAPDRRAWDLMLDHVDVAHYQQGQTLAGSRPDFELMQYLYRLRIISVDQFKVMQLPPPPTSPAYHRSQETVRANIGSSDEPYCAPYSRRREQRMRGQHRGVSVS
ncbi:conserved hypothetical protein [Aspergillus udagawae]|uniref:C2H2-type domain-containing protein n=2 Tax=Aspergillus udagawae TaxID=91492 RepID=A0ABQ1BAG9_9EURO|nr:conserved hypothetical protein [Aspergillus udagawae]GFF61510.1 conserved hypothetical protein [Aspergillus udagawae]GFF97394.1 conserved hypothetical protein [Aspergillus udagawae]GFG07789.1 conserved hypothetical protein [Aspergillus udagawae]